MGFIEMQPNGSFSNFNTISEGNKLIQYLDSANNNNELSVGFMFRLVLETMLSQKSELGIRWNNK